MPSNSACNVIRDSILKKVILPYKPSFHNFNRLTHSTGASPIPLGIENQMPGKNLSFEKQIQNGLPERSPTRNPLQVVKDHGNSPLRNTVQNAIATNNQKVVATKSTKFAALPHSHSDPNNNENSMVLEIQAPIRAVANSGTGSTIISRLRSRFTAKV